MDSEAAARNKSDRIRTPAPHKPRQEWQNFIDGKFVPSVDGRLHEVRSPATGELVAQVPRSADEDVDRAVAAAAHAFITWRETTPGERSRMLLQLADSIESHAEELIGLESLDVGKPRAVGDPELPFIADNLRFYAAAARTVEAPITGEYVRGYTSMVRRQPLGVVGLIAPWNYPLMMAIWKIGPALASGNTCVLKPAGETPLTTLRLAQLAAEILPPGVLNVISGTGQEVGERLVRHPEVRLVSLTGAASTGQSVASLAAGTLKRVHLELGGKAPVLVFDDADLEALAKNVRSTGYWNAGQECAAACRVLVAAPVYDEVLARLESEVRAIKVGAPGDGDDVEVGPVISEDQRQRVLGFIERADHAGARIIVGGNRTRDRGYFVEPTLIADAQQTDEIIQREVFGPVVTVQRFDSVDQAVAMANDVDYGLCASVWTTNVARALDVARRLEFGTVWINDHLPLASEMPWTGFKQSGYGRDMSRFSLDDYSQVKHVMAKLA